LGKLITGSFGTLGVIVEASLKLFPKPPERATFAMRAGTLGMARDLRRRILHSPLDPLRVVLVDSTAAALLANSPVDQGKPETDLRVEVGGSHRVIERCMHELRQLSTAAGAELTRVDAAEESWTKVSDLPRWLQPSYAALTILKAALPLTASEEFISRAQQEAEAEQIKLASFAQVGVGILHLCFLQAALTGAVAGLVNRLRQAATDLRGSLVIEQCPVELKKQLDVWGAAGDNFNAMRNLKSLFDPKDVLAPGRFVGGI